MLKLFKTQYAKVGNYLIRLEKYEDEKGDGLLSYIAFFILLVAALVVFLAVTP